MKFRQGFVTNSSSVNFTIIGKKIKDINAIDVENGKYYCIGPYMGEGAQDVFKIDRQILDAIIEIGFSYPIYKADHFFRNIDTVSEVEIEYGKYDIVIDKMDEESTTNADEFKYRYFPSKEGQVSHSKILYTVSLKAIQEAYDNDEIDDDKYNELMEKFCKWKQEVAL